MKMLAFALCIFFQADIPFKNSDEFIVNIELKFKTRPEDKTNVYTAAGGRLDRSSSAVFPFLVINITDLKILPDEVKMRAIDPTGKVIFKHKASSDNIHIDIGFVEDLKASDTTNEVVIYFISSEKKDIRKIVCSILKDGTFQVNGTARGKF